MSSRGEQIVKVGGTRLSAGLEQWRFYLSLAARYQSCEDLKDKVYVVCELVPSWRTGLEMDCKHSTLVIFSDAIEPGSLINLAFQLWSAMGLGSRNEFRDHVASRFALQTSSGHKQV